MTSPLRNVRHTKLELSHHGMGKYGWKPENVVEGVAAHVR